MAQILGRINHAIKLLPQPLIPQFVRNSAGNALLFRVMSIFSQKPIYVNRMPLLQAPTITLQQSCGMKVKGRLRRRCKDCYFVWREERLYVMCKTHGRHKQMSMKRKPHNTWILTNASQSKIREW